MSVSQTHVHSNFGGECFPEDIAPYVLLPTDAHHVEILAAGWQNARQITRHYEYLIYTGEYGGLPISACSTGIGGVSMATAVEELARLGAHTFISVGLADPVLGQPELGDLVIATGAVRYDSSSHDYARPEYPALAQHEVVQAAIVAAERRKSRYEVGVVASLAASGLRRQGGTRPVHARRAETRLTELEAAGVLGGSGEEATLFVQSAIYGLRAGAIVGCAWDGATGRIDTSVETQALAVAQDALFALASWDRQAKYS